ncbi:phage terminase large subunit [Variovorax sp. J22G73]|uniref:phage terminase large subunit n=1 Tax=unclassified Variovorax TaxID=663243 RepID=UPI0025784188|nr:MULTISPECIES: phage terminase large subunit [unclassified Variovorax]MDM0006432.1 phage terminase large subunit [Variovorax sp. J22R203]MDM0097545.1 phage terminase large subunit [Variovorax sp. J22G73]
MAYLIWDHLALPAPTPAQYEIAYFLQHGWAGYGQDKRGDYFHWFGDEEAEPDRTNVTRLAEPHVFREDVLEAFRGIGKSYLTSGFALWRLERRPYDEKILVVSASGTKAKEFVSMTKTLLNTMDRFEHLRSYGERRDTAYAFDVAGASISQSPSVKAAGITGQITGSRATLIIADDIEVTDNSRTVEARERLLAKTNEFSAIKVTGGADVICLGTPQTEESIYTNLIKNQGYMGWILPARFPTADKRDSYRITREGGLVLDCLCPWARKVDQDPLLAWKPTDPERFNEFELLNRESKGRAYFALQFQLDTSLSDAERYPLKLRDLIVIHLDTAAKNPKAPSGLVWGPDSQSKNRRDDLPVAGFSGDHWLGPMFVDPVWATYEQAVMFVDPSGRGADETAWAVVKVLNGLMYVVEVDGFAGDPGEAMVRLALCAKRHNVAEIVVEPNFAGGVWINAFQPVLAKAWPPLPPPQGKPGDTAGCSVIESEWAKGQKEQRIIDTLEPVMTTHRLIFNESVARDDQLCYQLTHISRERGSLTHDDRVDALAGAVSHLQRVLAQDVQQAKSDMEESWKEEELERVLRAHERMGRGAPRGTIWSVHEDEDGEKREVMRVSF